MAKNIYVGNLVWEVTHDELYALFQEHGQVRRAQVIMDRDTNRSRGFGFVEMNNDAEAQKAIEALNGTTFRGRALTVNEARPREERSSSGSGYDGARGGSEQRRGYLSWPHYPLNYSVCALFVHSPTPPVSQSPSRLFNRPQAAA